MTVLSCCACDCSVRMAFEWIEIEKFSSLERSIKMDVAVHHKLSCSNFSNIHPGCGASIKLSQESDVFIVPDHAVSKSCLVLSNCIRANNAQAVVPFAHTRSAIWINCRQLNRQPSSSSFMGKWQCQRTVKSVACVFMRIQL